MAYSGNAASIYNWTDGSLSSISFTVAEQVQLVVSYKWLPGSVTETVPGAGETTREYLLDAAGYPTELWMSDPKLGTRRLGATYSYVSCRLTHRQALYANGSVDPTQTADYEYDPQGHLTARKNSDGTSTQFDYSCW